MTDLAEEQTGQESINAAGLPSNSNVLLNDWPSYLWPDWVPEKTRQEIADFWNPKWGRSPKAWIASTVGDAYAGHPPMGTRVRCKPTGGGAINYEGRWIPAWNNMGRVLLDDGQVKVSSTCYLVVI